MNSPRTLKRITPTSLTDQFLEDAAIILHSVWNYIGHDSYECAEQQGETMTNAAAVEACIDADRPTSIHHDKVRAERFTTELRRLIQDHGYPAVLRALSRRFPLI